MGAGNDENTGRLTALASERESALWLTTLPTTAALELSDQHFLWAARLRLGMPVHVPDGQCHGCHVTDAYITSSWHSLSCTASSALGMVERHNSILKIFADFCTLMHLNVRMEPASLAQEDNRRPDLQVTLSTGIALGDVTITHPTNKTYKTLAAKNKVEQIGNQREQAKVRKYQQLAAGIGAEIHGIVFFTYGGFHRSATRFISKLLKDCDSSRTLQSPTEIKTLLKQHIAIAIQRGNAMIMINSQQREKENIMHKSLHGHLATVGASMRPRLHEVHSRARLTHDADSDLQNAASLMCDTETVAVTPLTAAVVGDSATDSQEVISAATNSLIDVDGERQQQQQQLRLNEVPMMGLGLMRSLNNCNDATNRAVSSGSTGAAGVDMELVEDIREGLNPLVGGSQ